MKKNRWMNRAAALLLGLMMVLCTASALAEDATALSSFAYTLDDAAGTVTLGKYSGSSKTVVVDGTYEADGKVYNTVIDSEAIFNGNTSITSVTLNSGISFADNSMKDLFRGCTGLTSIDVSQISTKGVTDMSMVFYNCTKLKTLDVSSFDTSKVTTMRGLFNTCSALTTLTGYENWDTGALKNAYMVFNNTKAFTAKTVIDLSKWDMDQVEITDWMFQECKAGEILLPDNLKVMGAGFMNKVTNLKGTSITIPAGVQYGGRGHVFYNAGTSSFKEFKVASGNKSLKVIDGVLYSKNGKWLLSVPKGKKYDGVIEIPEGVEELGEMSLAINKTYTKIILPDTFKFRQFVGTHDDDYGGRDDEQNMGFSNLNWGNNLSIAFYAKYTAIKDYEVKASNKNYKTVNGILYSKDMKRLLAIPQGYGRDIVVPEGVTTWETYACWGGASDNYLLTFTGVHIPSTMEYIAQDQVDTINALYKNRKSKGFKITVAEGCKNYGLDENGMLICTHIPSRCMWLMEDLFQYDGTPKEPEVKISLYEESIKEELIKAYDIWGATGSEREFLSYLTEGTDYTVEYLNNIQPGKATARAWGMNQYEGHTDKPFRIVGGPKTDKLPTTGDDSDLALWLGLMGMAFIVLAALKRRNA